MNNLFKRVIAMLVICFLIMANCITFADEIENTEEEANTPPITDKSIERVYDVKKNVYKYNLSEMTSFTSSVPNGIITNDNVYLDVSDKVKYELTKDGEKYSYVRGEPLTEDGTYNLKITTATSMDFSFNYASSQFSLDSALYDTHTPPAGEVTDTGDSGITNSITNETPSPTINTQAVPPVNDDVVIKDDETGLPDGTTFDFNFRILSQKCNDINVFNLPTDYSFKSIVYNDVEETEVGKMKYYLLEKDGSYTFTIYDVKNPEMEFTTKILIKRQLPVLKLGGVTNGLSTYEQVTVEKLTEETSYTVKLDGEEYKLYGESFIDAGLYTVTATDDYGNTNEYTFRILYTLNISSGTVIFLLVVIVAGLIVYTKYLNKHMRVS